MKYKLLSKLVGRILTCDYCAYMIGCEDWLACKSCKHDGRCHDNCKVAKRVVVDPEYTEAICKDFKYEG